jgi:hypothetical protein
VNQSIDNSYIGINPGSDEGRYLAPTGSNDSVSPQNNYKSRQPDEEKLNRRGILVKK